MVLGIAPDWRIAAVSSNAADFVAIAPDRLLGRQVAEIVHPETVHALRNRMALLGSGGGERLFGMPLVEGAADFDMLVQLDGEHALIDVLPAADSEGLDVAALVDRMARRWAPLPDVERLSEEAARAVRAITGFDSIAIWRSDGTLAATCTRAHGPVAPGSSPPPACDRMQAIGDIDAEPSAILFDRSGRTIDLSRSLLAPAQDDMVDFIRSAGARSALFIPLWIGERQWGTVVACHGGARMPGLARLSALELFARVLALEIASRERLA